MVLGAWCALASGAGWLNSMGVLMAWVTQNQLHDVPESTTAWIFSVYGFSLYFCGAQIGKLGGGKYFPDGHGLTDCW